MELKEIYEEYYASRLQDEVPQSIMDFYKVKELLYNYRTLKNKEETLKKYAKSLEKELERLKDTDETARLNVAIRKEFNAFLRTHEKVVKLSKRRNYHIRYLEKLLKEHDISFEPMNILDYYEN